MNANLFWSQTNRDKGCDELKISSHVNREIVKNVTEKYIKSSYLMHAAKVQLYRWYSFYENPLITLSNQLDLLSDDFQVTAGEQEIKGKKAYKTYIEDLTLPRTDAHRVNNVDLDVQTMRMAVNIDYIHNNLAANAELQAVPIDYQIDFSRSNKLLPNFKSLSLTIGVPKTEPSFSPSYANQRLQSLVHYWMALIEDPQRTSTPFYEILTKDFSLDFGSSMISSQADFDQWVAGPASSVTYSCHAVKQFSYQYNAASKLYDISMQLDWTGILPDQNRMIGQTHHLWQVKDNPKERFPKIVSINVETLKPFSLITEP